MIVRGVRLNIPPFLKGKEQFDEPEIITTRRIPSLRIHVERAMERIKNYHIFDRVLPSSLTDIAHRLFVCLFVVFCVIFIHPYVIKVFTNNACFLFVILLILKK